MNEYQLFITMWCLLIALNIYWGISSYLSGDWSGVAISAVVIGWMWKNIWRDYDEARGISKDDKEED